LFSYRKQVPIVGISDGTSNTIAYIENAGGWGNYGTGDPRNGWSANTWVAGVLFANSGTCPDATNPGCDFVNGRGLGAHAAGSQHAGNRINTVFGDGSVRNIKPDIDFNLYVYLCGYRDGRVVTFE
jgi:prepilin-type processing-associated H-X9-DG protein